MKFNVDKCKVLHIRNNNHHTTYTMNCSKHSIPRLAMEKTCGKLIIKASYPVNIVQTWLRHLAIYSHPTVRQKFSPLRDELLWECQSLAANWLTKFRAKKSLLRIFCEEAGETGQLIVPITTWKQNRHLRRSWWHDLFVAAHLYLSSCSIQGLSYTLVVLSPYLYLSSFSFS